MCQPENAVTAVLFIVKQAPTFKLHPANPCTMQEIGRNLSGFTHDTRRLLSRRDIQSSQPAKDYCGDRSARPTQLEKRRLSRRSNLEELFSRPGEMRDDTGILSRG